MRLIDYFSNPQSIPLRKLVELTRDLNQWSERNVDNPRSTFHRWYYTLANECERRGYDLSRILRSDDYTKEKNNGR